MNSFAAIIISNTILAVGLAVIALCITWRWRNPRLAHALWLLVLVKLVTSPVVSLPLPQFWDLTTPVVVSEVNMNGDAVVSEPTLIEPLTSVEPVPVEQPASKAELQDAESIVAEVPEAEVVVAEFASSDSDVASSTWLPSTIKQWPRFVLGIWILGTVFIVTNAFWRHRKFLRIVEQSQSAEASLVETAEVVSHQLGLAGCPVLRISREKIGPVVATRWWRVIVLFPQLLLREFTPEQTQSVLAHEFAHIHRRDYLVRCFELFVLALHWWNPVAWFASRQLRRATEECCDAVVVGAFPDERRSYGEALLRTVEFLTEGRSIAPALGSEFGKPVFQRRVETIMQRQTQAQVPWVISCLALVLGGFVLLFGVHGMPDDDDANVRASEPAVSASSESNTRANDAEENANPTLPTAAESEDDQWPPQDPVEFLKRLQRRDTEFYNRSVEIERRWVERVDPRVVIADEQRTRAKKGHRKVATPLLDDWILAPYDQPHRVPYRLTVGGWSVSTIDNADDLETMKHPLYGKAVSAQRWPDGPRRIAYNTVMMDGYFQTTSLKERIRQSFEWSSGYGFAIWMLSIDSMHVQDDRLVIKGKSRVFPHGPPPYEDDSRFEIELDRDLIVRRAVIELALKSAGYERLNPDADRIQRFLIKTSGTVRPPDAPPVAAQGQYRVIFRNPNEPEYVHRDETFAFVGISRKPTAEELAQPIDNDRKPYAGKTRDEKGSSPKETKPRNEKPLPDDGAVIQKATELRKIIAELIAEVAGYKAIIKYNPRHDNIGGISKRLATAQLNLQVHRDELAARIRLLEVELQAATSAAAKPRMQRARTLLELYRKVDKDTSAAPGEGKAAVETELAPDKPGGLKLGAWNELDQLDRLNQFKRGLINAPEEIRSRIEMYEEAYRAQTEIGAFARTAVRSPDKKLLVASIGNEIVFLETTTGSTRQRIVAHANGVSGLAFTPDGRIVASYGGDGAVRFWSAATGKEVQTIKIGVVGTAIAFSDDGREFGIASKGGVRYYEFPGGKFLRHDKDATKPQWHSPSEGPPAGDVDKQSTDNPSPRERQGLQTSPSQGLVLPWTTLKKLEKFIVWGKAASNGLQAGVVFDPLRDRYSTNDTLRIRLFVRTSKEEAAISVPGLLDPKQAKPKLIDQAGAEIPMTDGQHWLYRESLPRMLADNSRNPVSAQKPTEILIPPIRITQVKGWGWMAGLEAGQQYQLSFSIPNYGEKDGVPLETGKLRFDVVKPSQPQSATDTGAADRKVAPWGRVRGGLQAGVRCYADRQVIRADEDYSVDFEFVIRNVSDKPIQVTFLQAQHHGEVKGDIVTDHTRVMGHGVPHTVTIFPGKLLAFDAMQLLSGRLADAA